MFKNHGQYFLPGRLRQVDISLLKNTFVIQTLLRFLMEDSGGGGGCAIEAILLSSTTEVTCNGSGGSDAIATARAYSARSALARAPPESTSDSNRKHGIYGFNKKQVTHTID